MTKSILPNAWDIEDKSSSINIDSSGLEVNYIEPDDFKATIVHANHPISSQCRIFYFEIEIISSGKNGVISVGYCTKQSDTKTVDSNTNSDYINNMLMPGEQYESWGCSYHSDDGYLFCAGSGKKYASPYDTGDIIGCYINFGNKMVFYTKNGINLGIACNLPDDLKDNIYPCIGFKLQGGSVKANFGNKKFKYYAMTNEDINDKLNNPLSLKFQEKIYFIMSGYENTLISLAKELSNSLEKEPNNVFELGYRGKLFFIMGKHVKALEDLTKLLEIEPNNIMALRYRGEINFIKEKNYDSVNDLRKLLKIKPNDTWAMEAHKLAEIRREWNKFRCSNELFREEFHDWTSGNQDIDEFIQQTQLNAKEFKDIIEWIPFDKFISVKCHVKGSFCTISKAVWIDGFIVDWKNEWERVPQINVYLKSFDNSKDIKHEFLKEVELATGVYGITKNPKNDNYMIVLEQGNIKEILNSKSSDLVRTSNAVQGNIKETLNSKSSDLDRTSDAVQNKDEVLRKFFSNMAEGLKRNNSNDPRKEKAEEEKVDLLEEKINSLEKIISNMQKELEEKDEKFTRYSEKVDQHEEKIDNIKKTIYNMRDEQETKDNNLVDYQMKLVQVESLLNETKKKLEREKKIREILNSFYDELIQTCVEKALLKKEIEILEKKSKELEHKLDKDNDRIKILSDVEQLKNLLNGKQSKEKLIRDKIDLVQMDTDETSKEFYKIHSDNI